MNDGPAFSTTRSFNAQFDEATDQMLHRRVAFDAVQDVVSSAHYTVSSTSRNLDTHPLPEHFAIRFDTPHSRNVISVQIREAIVARAESNIVRLKTLTFVVGNTDHTPVSFNGPVHTVNIPNIFIPANALLANLSSIMTDVAGFPIQLTSNNNFVVVTSEFPIQLFPDVPRRDSVAIWNYAADSIMSQLGFSLTDGPVSGTQIFAPGMIELQGNDFCYIELKINGSRVGSIYELSCDGIAEGPYMAKLILATQPTSVAFCMSVNSPPHKFRNAIDIGTMEVRLVQPMTGNRAASTYNLNLREWEFDFVLNRVEDM